MGSEAILRTISMPVAESEALKQYLFMKINTSGNITPCGAGESAVGILQDNPNTTGFAGELAIDGVSKVVYGGTVTAGDFLMSDSSGRAVTATSTNYINGRARVSGVVNDIHGIIIKDGTAKA